MRRDGNDSRLGRSVVQHPVQWQPVAGCSYASPGCTNCKTMQIAPASMREEFSRDGLILSSKSGAVWTGEVRFSEARLSLPSETISATEFSVCPHSDLFHENVPSAWIDRVFDQIELCRQHTFQLLTKRSARMRDYLTVRYGAGAAPNHIVIGVSCERQAEADERIPDLQIAPAVWRSVTLFPLLGPINLRSHLAKGGINIVLVGQEDERPANQSWITDIAEDCISAGVRFHVSDRLVGQA